MGWYRMKDRPESGLDRGEERPGPDSHHDHDAHAHHSPEAFRDLCWISLLLTRPPLIWSELFQRWLDYTARAFVGSSYIPLIFGLPVFVYRARVFLAGA